MRMAFGGLLMGAIAIVVPEVCGNGYAPITAILHGAPMSVPVGLLLIAKIAATLLIVGSGAIGGIFTPSLFIGAALGSLIAGVANGFPQLDRKSVVEGQSVSVSVDLGCRRIIKTKKC